MHECINWVKFGKLSNLQKMAEKNSPAPFHMQYCADVFSHTDDFRLTQIVLIFKASFDQWESFRFVGLEFVGTF